MSLDSRQFWKLAAVGFQVLVDKEVVQFGPVPPVPVILTLAALETAWALGRSLALLTIWSLPEL